MLMTLLGMGGMEELTVLIYIVGIVLYILLAVIFVVVIVIIFFIVRYIYRILNKKAKQ